MKHATPDISPVGTLLLNRSVGELVAERPGRSRVFESFGIDFCCQGGRTLQEACEKKSVSADAVVEQLESELAEKTHVVANPASLPPHELVRYIVDIHHAYLRAELPRLYKMAERVALVHGVHKPSLVEVHEVFTGVRDELTSHMLKEEQILFPVISALSFGHPAAASLDGPISRMLQEHDEVGSALARLRELTDGYQPPAEACNTYRALFAGLHELEEDLHRHIHLENSVLFPAARAMVEAAYR